MKKALGFILIFLFLFPIVSCPFCSMFPVKGAVAITNYKMIIQVLETTYNESYYAIEKIAQYNLGNMIMLTQNSIEDEGWSLTDLEQLISLCNSLHLYVILCPYNYTDWTGQAINTLFVSPSQYENWLTAYPYLYGVCFPEVYGHQIEHTGYNDNSSGTIFNQIDAESQIPTNMTTLYNVTGFRDVGATILLQDNSISYITAQALDSTDIYLVKLFNSGNNEVMIGQGRGMSKSFNVSSWGVTIDLWGENATGTKVCPSPYLTATEASKALYESWYYGAAVFHWEQGSCNGSWIEGDRPNSGNILIDDYGNLTDYGLVVQNFYAFLSTTKASNKDETKSQVAIMIGQGGYGGRGPDWGIGILNRTAHTQAQAWMQYGLFNYFFPNISDGSAVLDAWTYVCSSLSKHFSGLPFGMVDIISIYASSDVLADYNFIFGIGWTCLNETSVNKIHDYAYNGGTFLTFATYLNSNFSVSLGDLENQDSFDTNSLWNTTFGCYIDESSMVYDKSHTSVNFHQNTFFYNYVGTSYTFASQWTWHFNMHTILSSTTKVIASYDNHLYSGLGDQLTPNATIVENQIGEGYVYVINAREDSLWMPDDVYGPVIGDFINRLSSYFEPPLLDRTYPDDDCLIHYNKTGSYILVFHDNTTTLYTLTLTLVRGIGDEKPYDFITETSYPDFIIPDNPYPLLQIVMEQNEGYVFYLDSGIIPIPLLPIPFIFGMIGLASMFIGPMYGVNKIKHKEFQSGFVTATVLTILGLALFIAWLWGSA